MKRHLSIKGTVRELINKADGSDNVRDNEDKIKTGLFELDYKTDGVRRGECILLAGVGGIGKTALALEIIKNNCSMGRKAVWFSNMSKKLITRHLLSMKSGIIVPRINRSLKPKDRNELKVAAREISEYSFEIDDTTCMNLDLIRKKCRKIKRGCGLDIVVIDYLQDVSIARRKWFQPHGSNYAYICKVLKEMAKNLDVCILIISSLPWRRIEYRINKRPLLSDLEKYGPIQGYMDDILLIYRDIFYHKDGKKNTAEVIVAKSSRGQPTGIVELCTDEYLSRFYSPLEGFMPIPDLSDGLPFC